MLGKGLVYFIASKPRRQICLAVFALKLPLFTTELDNYFSNSLLPRHAAFDGVEVPRLIRFVT